MVTFNLGFSPYNMVCGGVYFLVGSANGDAVIVAPYHLKVRLNRVVDNGTRTGQWEVVPLLLLPLVHTVTMGKSFNLPMPQFLNVECMLLMAINCLTSACTLL